MLPHLWRVSHPDSAQDDLDGGRQVGGGVYSKSSRVEQFPLVQHLSDATVR